jgi:cbb3-type cytochrome oxidase subunit 3
MEVGTTVLLGLALLFLGGIIYLIWKERNREQSQAAEAPILLRDSNRQSKNKP